MVTLSLCLFWQIISFIPPLWLLHNGWLNNDGKYCYITLKIIVMLQNVCVFGFWKMRSTFSFVCSLSCGKKWKKLTSSSTNQSVKKAKYSAYTRKYCCSGRKCEWSAVNINSQSFSTIEIFGDIIEMNFALVWHHTKSSWLRVEANSSSNAFSHR